MNGKWTKRAKASIWFAAWMPAALSTPFAQLPERADVGELERELHIMSRVLEDTLDQSRIEDWHWVRPAASAFDSKIEARYVPTVGAFFNLSVSFPILRHAGEEEGGGGERAEPDLWEIHRRRAASPIDDKLFSLNSAVGGVASIESGPLSILYDAQGLERRQRAAEPPKTEVVAPPAERGARGGATNLDARAQRIEPPAEAPPVTATTDRLQPGRLVVTKALTGATYDADRVKRMREAILGALGAYGHRISQLEASERVFIVIEAPRRLDPASATALNLGGVDFGVDAIATGQPILRSREKLRDRYLISVGKADLTEKTDVETLLPKITERVY